MSYVQTFTDLMTARTICLDSDGYECTHRRKELLEDLQEQGYGHGLDVSGIEVSQDDLTGTFTIKIGSAILVEDRHQL